jgi:transketolase
MNIDTKNIKNKNRDRFVLSKGHGAIALYSALYVSGVISEDEFKTFYKNGGDFPAHPVMSPDKGIEFSTGSLGMGLSLGIGSALASKINKIDYEVFVVLGNGECNEGAVWEAAMFARHHKMNNLTVIVDNNSMQSDGSSKIVLDYNLKEVWKGFGWDVIEVSDGNNIKQLLDALHMLRKDSLPRVIIANTVKGKGVSFMENNLEWHHSSLNNEQFNLASNELSKNINL